MILMRIEHVMRRLRLRNRGAKHLRIGDLCTAQRLLSGREAVTANRRVRLQHDDMFAIAERDREIVCRGDTPADFQDPA